jgi:hypothetical protein
LVCPNFFGFDRGQYLFGLFRMIPKVGTDSYFSFLGKQIELFIDVKDASSGKLLYPSSLELVL